MTQHEFGMPVDEKGSPQHDAKGNLQFPSSGMFNLRLYEKVRKEYACASHFPSLYAKTSGCQSFDWEKMLGDEKTHKVR
jgi:hypothetical protein